MSIKLANPPNVPQELHKPLKKSWLDGLRDRIEYESARFLLEHRQRIFSQEFTGSCAQFRRHRMLRVVFEKLESTYTSRITVLLEICARIDYLRRSLDALDVIRARRKCRLGVNRDIEHLSVELELREEDEQGMLEDIYTVAMQIAHLDRA